MNLVKEDENFSPNFENMKDLGQKKKSLKKEKDEKRSIEKWLSLAKPGYIEDLMEDSEDWDFDLLTEAEKALIQKTREGGLPIKSPKSETKEDHMAANYSERVS